MIIFGYANIDKVVMAGFPVKCTIIIMLFKKIFLNGKLLGKLK